MVAAVFSELDRSEPRPRFTVGITDDVTGLSLDVDRSFTTEPELPRAKARRLDRGSQYAVVAARQCLASAASEMAGREERAEIPPGTGSAGAGPLTEFERQMALESPESASPFLFPYTVANAPASVVAIELAIKGPNVTIIQKDPAALNALFYGRMMLQDSRADALLVSACTRAFSACTKSPSPSRRTLAIST